MKQEADTRSSVWKGVSFTSNQWHGILPTAHWKYHSLPQAEMEGHLPIFPQKRNEERKKNPGIHSKRQRAHAVKLTVHEQTPKTHWAVEINTLG